MTMAVDLLKRMREACSKDAPQAFDPLTVVALIDEVERLRADGERMREVLEWLDRGGGLGYDAHDRIRAALGEEQRPR